MANTSQVHYVRIQVSSRDAARQLGRMDRALQRTQTAAERMQRSFTRLNGALSVLVGANIIGGLVKDLFSMNDEFKEMGGRINLVAESTVGLAKAQDDLRNVANATYTSYEAIGTMYARVGLAADSLNLSHQQLLDITETMANTLRLSGASAQEARSSILQFSQAMSSGKLSGDEFRAMSEGNVALMRLLTEELGVSRKELNKMAKDQKLLATVVLPALANATDRYRKMVADLPVTIGRAVSILKNEWTFLFDEFEQGIPLTTSLAAAIELLAMNLGLVVQASISLAGALAFPYISKVAAALLGAATGAGALAKGLALAAGAAKLFLKSFGVYLVIEGVMGLIDAIGEINGALERAGASAKEGFLYYMETMINRTIGAFNSLAEYLWTWSKGLGSALIAAVSFEDIGEAWGTATAEGFISAFETLTYRYVSLTSDDFYAEMQKAAPGTTKSDSKPGTGDTGSELTKKQTSYLAGLDARILKEQQLTDSLLKQLTLIGLTDDARSIELGKMEKLKKIQEEYARAKKAGIDTEGNAFQKRLVALSAEYEGVRRITLELERQQKLYDKSEEWAQSFGDALIDTALGSKNAFRDMTISILKDIAAMVVKLNIVIPLANALQQALQGTFLGNVASGKGELAANGMALQGGRKISPFASGGVVNTPTLFPMANGAGLMGEAGPEAIMPLTRINGKLGVQAQGGGTNVTVINNSGGEATVTEQKNGDGGTDIQVMIERSVDQYINSGGANSTMGTAFGARPRPR